MNKPMFLVASYPGSSITEILAHMVLQTTYVTPCLKPLLTIGQRRKMAEDADHFGEGSYDAAQLMKQSDEAIAEAYLQSMADYVESKF